MLVAEKLGILFQTVDLNKEYKERFVNCRFAEYEKGRTSNPEDYNLYRKNSKLGCLRLR